MPNSRSNVNHHEGVRDNSRFKRAGSIYYKHTLICMLEVSIVKLRIAYEGEYFHDN